MDKSQPSSSEDSAARVLSRGERIALGIRAVPPRGSPPVHCSQCGNFTDPLRAPRVQVDESRFYYFCSPDCDSLYVPGYPFDVESPIAPEVEFEPLDVHHPNSNLEDLASHNSDSDNSDSDASAEKPQPASLTDTNATSKKSSINFRKPLLLSTSAVLGCVSAGAYYWRTTDSAIWLAGPAIASALLLSVVARLKNPSSKRKVSLASQLGGILAPLLAATSTVYSLLADTPDWTFVAVGTGLLCGLASTFQLIGLAETRRLVNKRPISNYYTDSSVSEQEQTPGEIVSLLGPCRLVDDATILSGQAQVRTWPGAPGGTSVGTGDTLYSGAVVEQGQLEVVIRWTRDDRSHWRLLCSNTFLARKKTELLQTALRLSRHGALGAGSASAISAWIFEHSPEVAALYFATGFALFANSELPRWIRLLLTHQVYRFVANGIFFREATGIDKTGRSPSVVLCALSTLLHNAPQVGNVEPLTPGLSNDELLCLAAGGYANSHSPIGRALEKATKAATSKITAARSPQHRPGLGTVAVTAEGKSIIVGTRALLLSQRISIASAELRIIHYENLGRTVLLVAVGGRLIGLLALQDQLRRGARGAVQNLLRSSVEPILLSGDSRETCQALARTTGISHVRPEVLPDARAEAITTLGASRNPLLVIGHSSADAEALEASDFAINLEGKGAPLERWDVEVASGSTQDATRAIADCRRLNINSQRVLCLQLLPLSAGLLSIVLGGPLWLAAVAATLGTSLAWATMRRVIDQPFSPSHEA